jgi:hypothetical protein
MTCSLSYQADLCVLDLILPVQDDLEDFQGQDLGAVDLVLVEWAADLVDFCEKPKKPYGIGTTHHPLKIG